jgi:hypothetical protein
MKARSTKNIVLLFPLKEEREGRVREGVGIGREGGLRWRERKMSIGE